MATLRRAVLLTAMLTLMGAAPFVRAQDGTYAARRALTKAVADALLRCVLLRRVDAARQMRR